MCLLSFSIFISTEVWILSKKEEEQMFDASIQTKCISLAYFNAKIGKMSLTPNDYSNVNFIWNTERNLWLELLRWPLLWSMFNDTDSHWTDCKSMIFHHSILSLLINFEKSNLSRMEIIFDDMYLHWMWLDFSLTSLSVFLENQMPHMKHFFRLLKSEDILCLALFKYLIRSKNGENNDFTYSSWKCLRITSKQNERGNIFILFPPYCFVALNLVVCWFFFTDKFLLNRIFFSKIQHFRIESYLFWWMRNYFEILWLKLNVNRMIK